MSLLLTNDCVGLVRGITAGESAISYYATCVSMPFDMLASRGVDITDEVWKARRELPIEPLKDETMTPMATRIMESARRLGFDWHKLDKSMFQDRRTPASLSWPPGASVRR